MLLSNMNAKIPFSFVSLATTQYYTDICSFFIVGDVVALQIFFCLEALVAFGTREREFPFMDSLMSCKRFLTEGKLGASSEMAFPFSHDD